MTRIEPACSVALRRVTRPRAGFFSPAPGRFCRWGLLSAAAPGGRVPAAEPVMTANHAAGVIVGSSRRHPPVHPCPRRAAVSRRHGVDGAGHGGADRRRISLDHRSDLLSAAAARSRRAGTETRDAARPASPAPRTKHHTGSHFARNRIVMPGARRGGRAVGLMPRGGEGERS